MERPTLEQNEPTANSGKSTQDRLIAAIACLIEPLGYEVVHIEIHTHRQPILRLFIDHLNVENNTGIGIQDCVKVTKALDEPLDLIPEVARLFKSGYELEVSSPGVDRPLRTEKDFGRFTGREVRIHVFRPLTAEELGNAAYQERNSRQKNFLGTLQGFSDGKVRLEVSPGKQESAAARPGKKPKIDSAKNSVEAVTIPLPLISKANLEPSFEISDERE